MMGRHVNVVDFGGFCDHAGHLHRHAPHTPLMWRWLQWEINDALVQEEDELHPLQ